MTLTKGLKHVGLNLTGTENILLSLIISLFGIVYCYFYFRSSKFKFKMLEGGAFGGVEKVFSILMLMTACAMAFAHGSNDVANAIGPLSAVVAIIESDGQIINDAPLAWWILPLGASGIMVGLIVMGYKVMATIGTGSDPRSRFCCTICYRNDRCRGIGYRITDLHHTNLGGGSIGYRFCTRYCGD